MTIVTTHTVTGSSTDWYYKNTPEFQKYLNETYIDTGLITEKTVLSVDKKYKTVTTTFKDDAARDKFTTDPLIIANGSNRDDHHKTNGIIDDTTSE